MAFTSDVYNFLEQSKDSPMGQKIWTNAYTTRQLSYHPFLMERMFSTFLFLARDIRSLKFVFPEAFKYRASHK